MDRPPLLFRLLAVLGAVGALGACGRVRPPAEDVAPRELLIEVLPRDAHVSLDGRPLGAGGRAVPAPAPGPHVLRIEAEGYEAVDRPLPDGDLAGVRVGAALRPTDLASERELDYDEAEGLARAAAHLARSDGRPSDAIAYAERALALDRNAALAHRALGDARAALGDARRAADSWAEYLRLAPGAPDAHAVATRIEAAAGAPPPAR